MVSDNSFIDSSKFLSSGMLWLPTVIDRDIPSVEVVASMSINALSYRAFSGIVTE